MFDKYRKFEGDNVMKKVKKITAMILVLSFVLVLYTNVFAKTKSKNQELEIYSIIDNSGVNIIITEEDNFNGSYTYREYWDGILQEEHTTVPGSGIITSDYYENAILLYRKIENIAISNVKSDFTINGWQYRDLGYMHYYDGIVGPISIFCKVEEYYSQDNLYVVNEHVAKSLSGWITTFVSGLGLVSAIATGVVENLIVSGVLSAIISGTITALLTYTVMANVYDQTIVGNCTSHSGKPTGRLTGQLAYVNTGSGLKLHKSGYNTTMWGTDALGRQMFWKVIGVEYTPTSWTGIW